MATEKRVTLKSVKQAMTKLQSRGDRPSNRNIRNILGGGSPNEIQAILQDIEKAEGAGVNLPTDLPNALQGAILKEVYTLISDATKGLQEQVQKTQAEQMDALDELEQAQEYIEDLRTRLDRSTDDFKSEQQHSKDLEKQIQDLKIERRQLIESREIALTAAAKAQLHVERADQAATKYETPMC